MGYRVEEEEEGLVCVELNVGCVKIKVWVDNCVEQQRLGVLLWYLSLHAGYRLT